MPIRPCSKRDSTTEGSMDSASSMARARGRIVVVAYLRTVSAMRDSVSERWVMGVGGTVERSRGSGGLSGEGYAVEWVAADMEGVVWRGRTLVDG